MPCGLFLNHRRTLAYSTIEKHLLAAASENKNNAIAVRILITILECWKEQTVQLSCDFFYNVGLLESADSAIFVRLLVAPSENINMTHAVKIVAIIVGIFGKRCKRCKACCCSHRTIWKTVPFPFPCEFLPHHW